MSLKTMAQHSLSGRAAIATLVLLIIGGLLAPTTLAPSSILSLLPFVAFLAVASIGQHLVIQQQGLDLSVAAVISFAAVIVTKFPEVNASAHEVSRYIGLALLMGLAVGAINGVIITLLKVPPLITTIGTNAVLFGITLMVSSSVPSAASPEFALATIGVTFGIPNTLWIAAAVAAIAIFIMGRTAIGRRFIAISVNPAAAHAVALPVERYRIATYMVAGLCYAIAGIMLAGFLQVPSIFCGNPYILGTVAAVVVGGNSVGGGARGSLLATVIGAFFLTFLSQLVLSAGLERSMQNVVQALIVIGGVGLPEFARRWSAFRSRSLPKPAAAAPGVSSASAGVAPISASAPVLKLSGIAKSFGPVEALKGADLDIYPGEIHAVVGENGAGKSTLINIAAGLFAADSGAVILKNRELANDGPRGRREAGIAVAYQHPALSPDLSVLENLQLVEPTLGGADGAKLAAELISRVATAQLQMNVHQRVGELSLAQRHVVEIARALATRPDVLFLDEPTEPFQQADIQKLFELIKALRKQGVAIVYVSHRLHEVTELADRISIMRDGEMVAARRAAEISPTEIIALIAGRPLGQIFPAKSTAIGSIVIEAKGLTGGGFSNVDFAARAGEIVGLAGVEGEGQREFLRAMACIDHRQSGEIELSGKPIHATSPGAARNAGIGFITDDRHAEGLFLNLSLRENIGIGVIDALSEATVIDRAVENRLAQDVIAGLRVRAPSIETVVGDLSGGNQQKVLFGREICARPKALLVDEPTKGVDIGARAEIYQRLRSLSNEGTAVVVACSDGVELEGLCDRVAIFARGNIVRELTGAEITDTHITEANLTATASRAFAAPHAAQQSGFGKWLGSDHFPVAVLIVLTTVILFGTNVFNEYFLSSFNITQMLTLLAVLSFIAIGQFAAIIVGGIDLSVGPLAGFVVVLASFVLPRGASGIELAGGILLILAICLAFGYAQGVLITAFRLPSIVVTLASFIGLQGLSLFLRPRPKGPISNALSDFFSYPLFGIPAGIILALLTVAIFEWLLYRHPLGRQLRAVGSSKLAALRLGVDADRVTRFAFATTGFMAGVGGLMLAGQVGMGSGITGIDYSLQSITAVVLGGVSVAGGRGSVLCALLGAALVQATTSASAFLSADSSWQYLVVGAITLAAACLFSFARRSSSSGRLAH